MSRVECRKDLQLACCRRRGNNDRDSQYDTYNDAYGKPRGGTSRHVRCCCGYLLGSTSLFRTQLPRPLLFVCLLIVGLPLTIFVSLSLARKCGQRIIRLRKIFDMAIPERG